MVLNINQYNKSMKIRLLIDGDYLVYTGARKFEETIDWGDGVLTTHVEVKKCKDWIRKEINYLAKTLEASEVFIALSGTRRKSFRIKLFPGYKKNRLKTLRPAGYYYIRSFMLKELGAMSIEELEADDVVGVMATSPSEYRDIVISPDKDFNTIPCELVDPFKLGKGLRTITREDAEKYFWSQVIIGDATDGYKGCPGYGPVKVKKLLSDVPSSDYAKVIRDVFIKTLGSDEQFIQCAQMAFILRHGYYDFNSKEIRIIYEDGYDEGEEIQF